MGRTALGRIAADFEETAVPRNGGDWRMAWHPPGAVLPGLPRWGGRAGAGGG